MSPLRIPLPALLLSTCVASAALAEAGQCLAPTPPGPFGDEFGAAMTTGDFNGDDLDDLAVHANIRGTDAFDNIDSGTVTVYLRQPDGSLVFDHEFGHEQSGAHYGEALASGRLAVLDQVNPTFDRDTLVIGAPGYGPDDARSGAGRVELMLRRDDGEWVGVRAYDQDSAGIPNGLEADDRFGAALAVGQFDDDTFDDLAIGAPGEANSGDPNVGSVTVLYGEATGINTTRTLLLHQGVVGVGDNPEAGDRFGASLAVGDLLDDGHDDLVVGAPGEDVLYNGVTHVDAGLVHAFAGGVVGLVPSASTTEHITEYSPIPLADNQRFGETLAVGRLHGTGPQLDRGIGGDLVVGAPGYSSPSLEQIGVVLVIYSSKDALLDPDAERQTILAGNIDEASTEFARFGSSLAIGRANQTDPFFETLLIGAPHQRTGQSPDMVNGAGAVYLVDGTDDGFELFNGRMFRAGAAQPCGGPQQGAQFGRSLAVLDPIRAEPGIAGSPARLAVGIPGLHDGGPYTPGAVELRGSDLFADGFED